jgi:hypothetical protein
MTNAAGRRACLFVSSSEGPRSWPFIMRPVGDELWTTTYAASAKVPVLRSCGTATCLLFDEEDVVYPYDVVTGRLSVDVPNDALLSRWVGFASDKNASDRTIRLQARLRTGKRLFIRVAMEERQTFYAD